MRFLAHADGSTLFLTASVAVLAPDAPRGRPHSVALRLLAAHPVDDVVARTIARGLIVASDPDLAPDVQAELAAMEQFADAALRDIAGSTASADTVALYDLLIRRRQDGTLTPQGQQWLQRVRAEADLVRRCLLAP